MRTNSGVLLPNCRISAFLSIEINAVKQGQVITLDGIAITNYSEIAALVFFVCPPSLQNKPAVGIFHRNIVPAKLEPALFLRGIHSLNPENPVIKHLLVEDVLL